MAGEVGKMTGWSHEFEPEVDSIAYVDFEEAPGEFDATSDAERRGWHVEMALCALGEAGVDLPESILYEELDLQGEELFWQWVERRVNEAGYDTYNSDTRFEVFPGDTPEAPES